MAQYSNNFYGIAVGSSDIESLIGGGAYSMTKGGDGSADFSSLLVVPDIPEYAVINSIKICCEGKQSRSNTSIYKSYVRFTPYLLNSYTINGKLYSSSIKGIIGSAYQERGTFKDSWNPYEIDLTSHNLSAADVRKGIRLALNMRFDGTTSLFETTASVRNIHIYVLFTIPEYTISVSAGTGGTVTGGGTFEQGRTVTIKATPNSGYRFVKWSDGNTSASRIVTVSGNATYTAVFEKLTYAITASAGAGGTISPSGSTHVSHGDSQTYTITPNAGYEIESVTVDGISQGAVSSFTFSNVTAAHTISVTFRQIPTYYLDLNGVLDGVSSGGISPYGTADVYINGALASNDCGDFWTAYPAGTTYEIKDIKANDGYQYDGVYSGSLSGTITAATSVVLSFSTIAKPPEFTSASLIYADSQVSQNNKVPAGESCILSVGLT